MKLFKLAKDGGPQSRVSGFFIIEIKSLFSIVLLRFSDGARDAYHTHAFNAWSWVLKGHLIEMVLKREIRLDRYPSMRYFTERNDYFPSWRWIKTPRECMHKVISEGTTWAITFRGPWSDTWHEYLPQENVGLTLTHGREVVEREQL